MRQQTVKDEAAPAPGAGEGGGLFGGLGPRGPLDCRASQQSLAAAMGLAPKTLWQWGRDRAFPAATAEGYLVREVLRWLCDQLTERGLGDGGEELTLKEKKLKAEIATLELKRAKLADQYVDKAACSSQLAIAGSVLSRRLLAAAAAHPEAAAAIKQALEEGAAQARAALEASEAEEGDDA